MKEMRIYRDLSYIGRPAKFSEVSCKGEVCLDFCFQRCCVSHAIFIVSVQHLYHKKWDKYWADANGNVQVTQGESDGIDDRMGILADQDPKDGIINKKDITDANRSNWPFIVGSTYTGVAYAWGSDQLISD